MSRVCGRESPVESPGVRCSRCSYSAGLTGCTVSNDNKKRILFVDDETTVLNLLKAVCRRIGPEWDAEFANSGPEALQLLAARPFDVIVSDMRMPEMNGVDLLHTVMEKYPRTARIILSGYADQQVVMRAVGAVHQYLSKPCDVSVLRSTLQRILTLDRFLQDEATRTLVARIHTLPSLPSLYFELMRELSSPHATTESVGVIISRDVSLTAKLLQLVNSAFFGVAQPVVTADEAVQILGFSTIKALALSIYVFSRFEPERLPGFPIDRLWNHSMATGLLARRIAASEGGNLGVIEAAFTSGILHDVGKLVLGMSYPDLYRKAVEGAFARQLPQWKLEQEILGAAHAEVGAYLLGLWGLPCSIVEAVAWHHQPQRREPVEFSPLAAVHVADYIQGRRSPASDPPLPTVIDRDFVAELNLGTDIAAWEETAGQV